MVAFCLALAACSNHTPADPVRRNGEIEVGMTYTEASAILGSSGKLSSRSRMGALGAEADVFGWTLPNGASLRVVVYQGKVVELASIQ